MIGATLVLNIPMLTLGMRYSSNDNGYVSIHNSSSSNDINHSITIVTTQHLHRLVTIVGTISTNSTDDYVFVMTQLVL